MKASGWRERYAGYEPGLHDIDHLFPLGKRHTMALGPMADHHAGPDWRLASSRPLKPTRKVNGLKGQ
jgi:hypothetical protein